MFSEITITHHQIVDEFVLIFTLLKKCPKDEISTPIFQRLGQLIEGRIVQQDRCIIGHWFYLVRDFFFYNISDEKLSIFTIEIQDGNMVGAVKSLKEKTRQGFDFGAFLFGCCKSFFLSV